MALKVEPISLKALSSLLAEIPRSQAQRQPQTPKKEKLSQVKTSSTATPREEQSGTLLAVCVLSPSHRSLITYTRLAVMEL